MEPFSAVTIADPVIDDTTTVVVSPAGKTKKLFLPLVMK
jgi:hypothetical protein